MSLLIDRLVNLANTQYVSTAASPDDYAQKAAHLAVRDINAAKGAPTPDAVAFLESLHALSALLASAQLSARLADKAAAMHDANKQYDLEFSASTACVGARSEPSLSHEKGLNSPEFQTLIQRARATYDDIKKQQAGASAWSDGMCMRYMHVYAVARAAFLHALAAAAPYSEATSL